MKSYHSSALPITAAAIWKGFGVTCVGDILFPLAVHVFERSQNPNHIMFVNDARGCFTASFGFMSARRRDLIIAISAGAARRSVRE
jgi:hypothetical protein